MNIRADSTELATATVSVDHDITGKVIQVALPLTGQATASWIDAEVLNTAHVGPNWVSTYQLLIGPASGDVTLSVGTYDWTVKVVDDPEVPVRKAGVVVVTAN